MTLPLLPELVFAAIVLLLGSARFACVLVDASLSIESMMNVLQRLIAYAAGCLQY